MVRQNIRLAYHAVLKLLRQLVANWRIGPAAYDWDRISGCLSVCNAREFLVDRAFCRMYSHQVVG